MKGEKRANAVLPLIPIPPKNSGAAENAQMAAKRAEATHRAGTKYDTCKNLYFKYHGSSRKEMIEEFINTAGCTPKGAATYYAKLKKAHG